MTNSAAPRHDAQALQRMIETFEHQLEQFHGRVLSSADRAAICELRDLWSRLVDVLISPLGRVRSCASCKRSQLRAGPRCVYCWHRFERVAVAGSPAT
jgi:DNA replicative helicase MCM subunit Mcm2 (Cdc46/Mcm family)